YVNDNATGDGSGTSWANAFTSLQAALAWVDQHPNQVSAAWVAAGTYKPGGPGDRDASFALREGLTIYGGFAGNESRLEDRDPDSFEAILSGRLGTGSWAFYAHQW